MNKQFAYQIGDQLKTILIERVGERFRVVIDDTEYSVAARQREPGLLDLEVDGQRWRVHLAHEGTRHYVAIAGETWVLEKPQTQHQPGRKHGADAGTGSLTATMPGLVRDVLVAEGAKVARGDTLVVLEAMKMELRITAPYAGRVSRVHCAPGQGVERGQTLVEMEEQS